MIGSELVTTGNSPAVPVSGIAGTIHFIEGHRCVRVDLKIKGSDMERQLRDESLLKKWPGFSGVEREQLLAEGLKPETPSPSASLN